MTARNSFNTQSSNRCNASAVAASSARIIPVMDAAINLVVSICIIALPLLLALE